MLRGKTVDEIVTKWTTDLDNHVRDFNAHASEVASWDRALIQNGNNVRLYASKTYGVAELLGMQLSALYNMVLAAEQEQNEIDQSLDHIEQHQRDLSATLDVYEKSAEEVLGGQGGSLRALDTGPADTERDKK
jgi:nuclear pore complex protein Nup62